MSDMHQLTSIVALNEDGVIGAGNSLPWRIRTDLNFFRDTTMGNVVIMGRKTFDSLGKPLKGRLNIVVTHGFGLSAQSENCLVAHSIEEAIAFSESKRTRRQEVFVIGGATMYSQFAPYVDRYLVTDVDKKVPEGDTFFSPTIFGPLENWKFQTLLTGDGRADGDETTFRICEMTAEDRGRFGDTRKRAVALFPTKQRPPMRRSSILSPVEEVKLFA